MTITTPELGLTPSPPRLSPPLKEPPSAWRRGARTVITFTRRSPMSAVWGLVALAIVLMAVAAPVLAPHDPLKSNFRAMTKPPSAAHAFGTDQIRPGHLEPRHLG